VIRRVVAVVLAVDLVVCSLVAGHLALGRASV
jgi:hypothetical protein